MKNDQLEELDEIIEEDEEMKKALNFFVNENYRKLRLSMCV